MTTALTITSMAFISAPSMNLLPTLTPVPWTHNNSRYEPGIQKGISGLYAGKLNGRLVVAGGCNFPEDPLGKQSKKHYYSGIYVSEPLAEARDTLTWYQAGELPGGGRAYGAAISTAKGLVLIGGTDSLGTPLSNVELLTLKEGYGGRPIAECVSMMPLPVGMDNFAAAYDGQNTVYLCGGNVNGVPSAALWSMDLQFPEKGWASIGTMPGNPRVQPVAAFADGSLWIWGGFAGKSAHQNATVETGGLCYNPDRGGKWGTTAGPKNANGKPVTLAGGCVATLPDGSIAAIGGVNKDVFLAALQYQPEDYLDHPTEWYRFNRTLYVFDPKQRQWEAVSISPSLARAGASAVSLDRTIWLIGGELQPRIRTAQTLKIEF